MKLFVVSLFAFCLVASASADIDILHLLGDKCGTCGTPVVGEVLKVAKPIVTLLDKTGCELLGSKNWNLVKNTICKDAIINANAAKCKGSGTNCVFEKLQCMRTAGVCGLDDVQLIDGKDGTKVCKVLSKTVEKGSEKTSCDKLYKTITKLIGLCAPSTPPSCGCGKPTPPTKPTCETKIIPKVVDAALDVAAAASAAVSVSTAGGKVAGAAAAAAGVAVSAA